MPWKVRKIIINYLNFYFNNNFLLNYLGSVAVAGSAMKWLRDNLQLIDDISKDSEHVIIFKIVKHFYRD